MSDIRDRIVGYGLMLEHKLIQGYNVKKDETTERPTIDVSDYGIKRKTIHLSTNPGLGSFFKADKYFEAKKNLDTSSIPKNKESK